MGKLIDLTGQKFGRLLVLERAENAGKETRWLCRCDCGNECSVKSDHLRSGNTQSCGCLQKELASERQKKNLQGQKFGRLTVIEEIGRDKSRRILWRCRCDCGNECVVRSDHLRDTQSCGCYMREKNKTDNTIHGGKGTRIYHIWRNMKARCYRHNNKEYHRYGGRGITVCEEWLHNFVAFREWALSYGYSDELTIDRIDPDKNYEPSNCQWLTKAENSRKMHADRKKTKTE